MEFDSPAPELFSLRTRLSSGLHHCLFTRKRNQFYQLSMFPYLSINECRVNSEIPNSIVFLSYFKEPKAKTIIQLLKNSLRAEELKQRTKVRVRIINLNTLKIIFVCMMNTVWHVYFFKGDGRKFKEVI